MKFYLVSFDTRNINKKFYGSFKNRFLENPEIEKDQLNG
jgi:hypothetical protein